MRVRGADTGQVSGADPAALAAPRSDTAGLAVLFAALALVVGSMTSLTTALPAIGASTGASQSDLTWIVDSYTLAFAGLLLPCGALGDRYGRRRMLVVGLGIFAAASVAGTAFDSSTALIVARAVAGLGAALVMPATLSLITTVMRGAAQERAVGLWAAVCTIGGVLGVIVAGLVLESFTWRAILYGSAGLALLLIAAAPLVPESVEPGRPRLDLAGAVTGAAAVGLVVFAILEAPAHGWGSGLVLGCLGTGIGAGVAFAAVELRVPHPLLDLRIFRSRTVAMATLVLLVGFVALFAFFFLSMQYLQLVQGRSPLEAGLVFAPMGLTLAPLSIVAPAIAARVGLRLVSVLGLLGLIPALLLMAGLGPDGTRTFLLSGLLLGAALGLCITPATLAILRSLPRNQQGVASAVNDAAREIGAALGIAIGGSLLATGYARGLGPSTDALPAAAQEQARASLGGTLEVAARLGPDAGPAVVEAQTAFLAGMHDAFVVVAALLAVSAVVVAVLTPGGAEPPKRPAGRHRRLETAGPAPYPPPRGCRVSPHFRIAALLAAALVAVTPLPAVAATAAPTLSAKCSKADQNEFRKRDAEHADICLDRRWVTIEGTRRTLATCGSSTFAGQGGYVSDETGTVNYCLPPRLVGAPSTRWTTSNAGARTA